MDGHQEQRVIAAPEPRALIGRGEQRVDLGPGEKGDLAPRETLAGHGEHALDLRGMGGGLECGVSKERVDGGQPQIPAPHTQAVRFELIQKRADQRGVHGLQTESRRRRVQPLVGKFQEQAERIAIGRNGVGARLSLLQETVREEPFQEGRQRDVGGIMTDPPSAAPRGASPRASARARR